MLTVTPWTTMRGDALHRGRYRLVEELVLPRSMQNQGTAWLALDMQKERRQVIVRKLTFVDGSSENAREMVNALVRRMATFAEHQGMPKIVDGFQEQGSYYLVQEYKRGDSLSVLMRQQGGALAERDVAEYGRQICEILILFAHQQPAIIYGAINTETIVISPDKKTASLLYLPLLPPMKLPQNADQSAGYLAPEQARGGDAQPSSDLYALAATMHHAVTGFDPRERMVFFYPPARRLNPLVSSTMETILSHQLRFSVSQRYNGPEDMRQQLSVLIATYPLIEKNAPSTPVLPIGTRSKQSDERIWNGRVISIVGVALVLLVCFFFVINPLLRATNTAHSTSSEVALKQEMALELQSFQKKGIGLSDGQLVFDTYQGRKDVQLKSQAATAQQQGNLSAAVNLLNQAVNVDPTDGEAQIYNENLHIQQDNSPYVTLALGMPIAGSANYLGSVREQLEAAYLDQQETNSQNLLPGGLKLRILIANSGASNANVATVAQFIANRVSKAGNPDHLIGVIGWYNSTQTIDARDIIAGVHLPLIAPTASSVKLSGSSAYFFRVAPPDNLQGKILGQLLISKLQAKRVLILNDPTDSYSVSLADAVASQIKTLNGTFTVSSFTEDTTTVDQYQKLIQENIEGNAPANVVFIAGFNIDGIRLAHAVGNLIRANPFTTGYTNLRIVGGDSIDSGLLLGEGNSADAMIATNYPQDMRLLTFTTFADFHEWTFLKEAQKSIPIFFSDWKSTYQNSLVNNSAPDPTYKGLMMYDALGVSIDAAKLIHGPMNGDELRHSLTTLGQGNVPAYQGISGRIAFDGQGNPINKAIVILTIQSSQNGNMITIQQVLGTFS